MNWQKLYSLGARKFGILGVAPLGCLPIERALNKSGGCMDEMNNLALSFYQSTQSLLQNYSTMFPRFNYSLGNIYQLTMDAITDGNVYDQYIYL